MAGEVAELVDVLRETRVRNAIGGLDTLPLATIYSQISAYIAYERIRTQRVTRLERTGPGMGPGEETRRHMIVVFEGQPTLDIRESDIIRRADGSEALVYGVRKYEDDVLPSTGNIQCDVEFRG